MNLSRIPNPARRVIRPLGLSALATLAAWSPLFGQDVPVDTAVGPAQIISNFTVDRDVFGGGNFYWAIAEKETSEIVARGKMDVEGIDRIILRPRTVYRMLSFYEETLSLGSIDFTTPGAGRAFQIPCMEYVILNDAPDKDNDGLPDPLELIAGTNADNPDTDGDGFQDGAEVRSGDDPLDGFFSATGIIASGPTPDAALDVCTINNVAVVACGDAGLSVFNVRQGDAPTRIAQVNTSGFAKSVACFSNYIAVADGPGGLAVVDITDPPASRVLHQLKFNSPVNCVTARGNFAFAGLDNGTVVMVDMLTGAEIGRRLLSTRRQVQDLAQRDGYLYALVNGTLHTLEIADGDLNEVGTDVARGSAGAGRVRQRLSVGDNFLYATYTSGFNHFSLANVADPVLVNQNGSQAQGWKHIVPNGTGLGVAAVSPNSTADGAHDVNLYRTTGEWDGTESFVTTYETPGRANAVSLYNGLAYVADGDSGLQVINFLAFDTAGQNPTITLSARTSEGNVEEGKVFTVQTPVNDDVMVRNVEYFVDGVPVALDGNFPFELGLISPTIQGEKNTFDVHAVVTDTGGNTARSETTTIGLVPDATPPRVVTVNPPNGQIIGNITSILVVFSEPIDARGLKNRIRLRRDGPDRRLNTADDEIVMTRLEYSEATSSLSLIFPTDSVPGLYRLEVDRSQRDLAGNRMREAFSSSFRIYGFEDLDKDGVPDDLEESLGLDPNNPDTDGNGVRDGFEDFDRDGLVNVGEVILGRNPTERDSDGNGILDGAEDTDFDNINDGDEIRNGTDATNVDTDGDGITDYDEILIGGDPLDPGFSLPMAVSSDVVTFLNAAPESALGTGETNLVRVASNVITFYNAEPILPSEVVDGVTFTIASKPASFLNAAPETGTRTIFQYSPVISYENQAQ